MKKFIWISSILSILIFLQACSSPKKGSELDQKKAELEKLKKDRGDLSTKIFNLEEEIREIDPGYFDQGKGKPVTVIPVKQTTFNHYFEVQGTAESENSIAVSTDMGGLVTKVLVDEGDKVNEGQLLVQLDNSVVVKNIDELETSLELAKKLYEKQKRLWEKNIGSEVDYLQSKNRKEQLEGQLASAQAQLNKTKIKAPFSGTVDRIYVKVGEVASPGMPAVRVMNLEQIKIEADVSENYLGSMVEGDSVDVHFPAIKTSRKGIIKSVGQYIDPANRSFKIYVRIPNTDRVIKANLLATVSINDYTKKDALVIPTRLIQFSRDGEYIYVESENEHGHKIAKKVFIQKGKTYKGHSVIEKGLNPNDKVVDEGHRDLANGDKIEIVE
ncbi:MAG: efflux RND transporter periplasmic adaptor subunit [Chitinophagales bacterium]